MIVGLALKVTSKNEKYWKLPSIILEECFWQLKEMGMFAWNFYVLSVQSLDHPRKA